MEKQPLSQGDWEYLSVLKERRNKILNIQEVTYKLKIREIWLLEGDRNTKYFHKFANHRKKTYSIWNIEDMNGELIYTSDGICVEVVLYFMNLYKHRDGVCFED